MALCLTAAVASLALASCGTLPTAAHAHKARRRPGANVVTAVEVATARSGTAISTLTLSGTVAADTSLTLSAGAVGKVASIDVSAGQSVHAGQVLLSVSNPVLQAQLASAKDAVATAQAKLAAAEAPASSQAVAVAQNAVAKAQATLTAAQSTLAAAQAAYAQAQQAQTTTTSPPASSKGSATGSATATARAGGASTGGSAGGSGGSGGGSAGGGSGSSGGSAGGGSGGGGGGVPTAAQLNSDQEAVSVAQAGLNLAQAQLAQAQAPPSAASLAPLSDAVAQATAAEGVIQTELAADTLSAPFAGTVTSVLAQPGEQVATGTAVLTLQGTGLEVKATVSQSDASLVHAGESATLSVPGARSALPAKVATLAPAADPTSLSFQVTLDPVSDPTWLHAGEAATASVVTATDTKAVLVPASAIVSINGYPQVFVLSRPTASSASGAGSGAGSHPHAKTAPKVSLVDVHPSVSDGSTTEVSGLAAGTKVVVLGQTYLAKGDPVRVTSSAKVPATVTGSSVGGLLAAPAPSAAAGSGAGGGGGGAGVGGAGAGGLGGGGLGGGGAKGGGGGAKGGGGGAKGGGGGGGKGGGA